MPQVSTKWFIPVIYTRLSLVAGHYHNVSPLHYTVHLTIFQTDNQFTPGEVLVHTMYVDDCMLQRKVHYAAFADGKEDRSV
jgi:hypothetical protein